MNFLKISVLLIFIGLVGCNRNSNNKNDNNAYNKATQTLAENEAAAPNKYVSATISYKKNLLGQAVVSGTVKNNAKITTYKDVELSFSFYSSTGTLLETDHETLYDSIAPGGTLDYKSKYYAPKSTDSATVTVVNAAVN